MSEQTQKENEKEIKFVKNRISESYGALHEFSLFATIEGLLKNPGKILFEIQEGKSNKIHWNLLLISILSFAFYGLIIGLFSGGNQIFYAIGKVSIGLIVSALLCLPSLYVFMSQIGSEISAKTVIGILLVFIAIIGLLLVAFSPILWLFNESTDSLRFIGTLHFFSYLISVIIGFGLISKCIHFLTNKSTELIRIWVVLFLFVTFQMSTTLRPILGTSETILPNEKTSFILYWMEDFSLKKK